MSVPRSATRGAVAAPARWYPCVVVMVLAASLVAFVPPAAASGPAVPDDGAVSGATAATTDARRAGRRVDIKVTDAGFEPRQIRVKAGEPTTLAFTRTTAKTCITAIDIPDEDVKGFELPLNRTVTLTITPKKKGTEPFHCTAMGMGNGRILVE